MNLRAGEPGGWTGLVYRRLHGAPELYASDYVTKYLDRLVTDLSTPTESIDRWCIFDNTMLGHATANALYLQGKGYVGGQVGVAVTS